MRSARHAQRVTTPEPLPDYSQEVKASENVSYLGYTPAETAHREAGGSWAEFEPALNSGRYQVGDQPHQTLRTSLGLAPKVAPRHRA